MSLSEQTSRVANGGKNTLKAILEKMGATVPSTTKIDGYPALAAGVDSLAIAAATKTRFGLEATADLDDVLAILGKYRQYWWARRTTEHDVFTASLEASVSEAPVYPYYSGESISLYVGESYTFDEDTGAVSINSPALLSPTATSTPPNINEEVVPWVNTNLVGKYFKKDENGTIYYLGNSINWSNIISSSSDRVDSLRVGSCQYVKVDSQTVPAGEWEYVQSSDRNAYPDSGESGGYEYQYLGVPLDNAVEVPKIATGSYVGTGTYGTGAVNTLTFESDPVLLLIAGVSSDKTYIAVIMCDADAGITFSGGQTRWSTWQSAGIWVTKTGNKVDWCVATGVSASDAPAAQMNLSGITYTYAAILS